MAQLRSRGITVDVGPFVAIPGDGAGGPPDTVLATGDAGGARENLPRLRRLFQERGRRYEVEVYPGTVPPDFASALEASGLIVAESKPLLGCLPSSFVQAQVDGVTVEMLDTAADDETLRAFQAIRWHQDAEGAGSADGEVARLREHLAAGRGRHFLARRSGDPAGTAVGHSNARVTEIVGVVTSLRHRRQGVASAVTSAVTADAFARGDEFAFMDVANEEAGRVYERLGFRPFGDLRLYRDPDPAGRVRAG